MFFWWNLRLFLLILNLYLLSLELSPPYSISIETQYVRIRNIKTQRMKLTCELVHTLWISLRNMLESICHSLRIFWKISLLQLNFFLLDVFSSPNTKSMLTSTHGWFSTGSDIYKSYVTSLLYLLASKWSHERLMSSIKQWKNQAKLRRVCVHGVYIYIYIYCKCSFIGI